MTTDSPAPALPELHLDPAALPLFDPVGLVVATWTDYWRAEREPNGAELLVEYRPKGTPPWVVLARERRPLPDGPLTAGLYLRARVALRGEDAATRDRLARWILWRAYKRDEREGRAKPRHSDTIAPGWKRQDTGWALLVRGRGVFFSGVPSHRFPEDSPYLVPGLATLLALGRLQSGELHRCLDGSSRISVQALLTVAAHVGRWS
jgi:hypothetical protein